MPRIKRAGDAQLLEALKRFNRIVMRLIELRCDAVELADVLKPAVCLDRMLCL